MGALKLGLVRLPSYGALKRIPSLTPSLRLLPARAMAATSTRGLQTQMSPSDAAISTVITYHEETKHAYKRYAKGPHGLDWANQPNPFRRYEGAVVVNLEHLPAWPARSEDPLWPDVFANPPSPPKVLDRFTLSQLLYDSLALSAWKAAGRSTWSLRVNPSSGNLHPTEGYVISDAIEGVSKTPFIAHYAPKDHALEIRAEISIEVWNSLSAGLPPGSLLVGFTSIFWRESWKYGERAFRYCNHDVGHAIGAFAIAAASLGWNSSLLDTYGGQQLDHLFGLPRTRVQTDRGPTKGVFRELETEHADCVLAIYPFGQAIQAQPRSQTATDLMNSITWLGEKNALSKEHVRWGIIYQAAQASVKNAVGSAPSTGSVSLGDSIITPAVYESLTVRQVVRKRRSALDMDGDYGMVSDVFYQILFKTLPTGGSEAQGDPCQLPFGVLAWKAEVHLVLFVHRVVGLRPGIYILVRNEEHMKDLGKAMRKDFEWEKPDDCPPCLPLYGLYYGDCKVLAPRLSCNQEIAGDSCFSLGMLARFEPALRDRGAWMYPRLFWETGLIGQVLYLEAHAFGISATGIGCFFDDPVHDVFGIKSKEFQSLYHFTIGVPVIDKRILNLPAYPGPVTSNF